MSKDVIASKRPMNRFQLLLDDEDLGELQRHATAEKTSKGEILRRALRLYIRSNQQQSPAGKVLAPPDEHGHQ